MDGCSNERRMGVRFLEEGREWDCLASCMQMTWFCMVNHENLKVMVGHFVNLFDIGSLKVSADETTVTVLAWE